MASVGEEVTGLNVKGAAVGKSVLNTTVNGDDVVGELVLIAELDGDEVDAASGLAEEATVGNAVDKAISNGEEVGV